MAEISRKSLFGKLNATTYKCVEAATVFCKMRGNPYVELVHWIHQFLQLTDTDLHRIVKQYNINPSNLARDITESLDKLPRGASSISDLSDHVEDAVERGWVYGSLMFNEPAIRSGHVIIGCLKTRSLKNVLMGISAEFDKVDVDDLCAKYEKLLGDSPEARSGAADGSQLGAARGEPGEASGAIAPAQMGREDAIKQFCVDLTERARNGEIDPIVGRDAEVRQIVDILMRRRQNNPILTGEAGVGKTAVVEGFAHRIVDGDVPPPMQNVRLLSLDVGASSRRQHEGRVREPAQAGHRRGPGIRARSSCSSTRRTP
jgi:type VI secretion system protein VasG